MPLDNGSKEHIGNLVRNTTADGSSKVDYPVDQEEAMEATTKGSDHCHIGSHSSYIWKARNWKQFRNITINTIL